ITKFRSLLSTFDRFILTLFHLIELALVSLTVRQVADARLSYNKSIAESSNDNIGIHHLVVLKNTNGRLLLYSFLKISIRNKLTIVGHKLKSPSCMISGKCTSHCNKA